MSVFFDNIDVTINRSGILASSATINSNNSIESAFVIGYCHPIDQLPFGPIKTNFTFDYIPEVNYEPNFGIATKLKNLIPDTGYIGERVEIAGIRQNSCFLESYSLKVQPNSVTQSSASYVTFNEPTGSIRSKVTGINYLNDGGISHSWTTYVLQTGAYLNVPVYNLNYDFKANWQPIYIVGRKTPIEVKLLTINETINFTIDQYRNILFTGENVIPNIFESISSGIQLNSLSFICTDNCNSTGEVYSGLYIDINNFKINTINVVATKEEFIRVNYTCSKSY